MDHLFRTLLLSITASLLAACASGPDRSSEDWQGAGTSIRVMEYVVRPGDSLAAISRELTGDIENWAAVAEFNNITDPSIIQVGDIVLIPSELFPPEQQALATKVVPVRVAFNQLEPTVENNSDIDIASPKTTPAASDNTTGPVFQRSALPGTKLVAVTTRPVIVNRTFSLSRTRTLATQTLGKGGVLVEVGGSGSPKSIFAQPFNHSPLLMQAEPGATFTLDQQLGEWLRIKTEKGAGYIRRRDAKMIGASYTNPVTPVTAVG